jgi:YhcH/YjgK/YiaL family protein
MIYDKIDNLETYVGISDDIRLGLEWLRDVKADTAVGVYQINHRVKVIVSEYETKIENEHGFEAHRKFIDIQYLLSGKERIACLPIEELIEAKPYSEEKDAAFYSEKTSPINLTIGDDYFAIFFPQDGHKPQLCIDKPMVVKKVVIKVEI